jgi:WD40 repeat protein
VRALVVHGNKLLSGSFDSTITWACERTLEGHTKAVTSLVVHGDKLISGSCGSTIKVWGS